MKWTNDLVLEFLNLYKQRSVIWDLRDMNYKNRKEVTRAWDEIKAELSVECTVDELKKKKESLMTLYRTLRRKVVEKEGSYKPTWFAFDAMDTFLKGTRKSDIYYNTEIENPHESIVTWTNDLVLEFLNLYKQRPVIWNLQNTNYKNRREVTSAWNEIKEELSVEFTVDELKRKKESLMALYRTFRRKVVEKEGSYKPTWFAFEAMDTFLKGTRKIDICFNTEVETDYNNYYKSENCDETFENSRSQPSPELIEITRYQEKYDLEKPQERISKPHISKPIKRKLEPLTPIGIKMQKGMNDTSDNSQISQSFLGPEQPDDCCLYGQLLAVKLRAMDRRTRTILINKIDNLVFKTELKTLDPLSTQYYSETSDTE